MSADGSIVNSLEAREIVYGMLPEIEDQANATLISLCCRPSSPVAPSVYVNRQQPWPMPAQQRNRQRAMHALETLNLVVGLRRYLAKDNEREAVAAGLGLLLGLLAHDHKWKNQVCERTRERARRAGRARAKKLARQSAGTVRAVRQGFTEWKRSDSLQDQFRSPVPHIEKTKGLKARTIRRYLQQLGLSRQTGQ